MPTRKIHKRTSSIGSPKKTCVSCADKILISWWSTTGEDPMQSIARIRNWTCRLLKEYTYTWTRSIKTKMFKAFSRSKSYWIRSDSTFSMVRAACYLIGISMIRISLFCLLAQTIATCNGCRIPKIPATTSSIATLSSWKMPTVCYQISSRLASHWSSPLGTRRRALWCRARVRRTGVTLGRPRGTRMATGSHCRRILKLRRMFDTAFVELSCCSSVIILIMWIKLRLYFEQRNHINKLAYIFLIFFY